MHLCKCAYMRARLCVPACACRRVFACTCVPACLLICLCCLHAFVNVHVFECVPACVCACVLYKVKITTGLPLGDLNYKALHDDHLEAGKCQELTGKYNLKSRLCLGS